MSLAYSVGRIGLMRVAATPRYYATEVEVTKKPREKKTGAQTLPKPQALKSPARISRFSAYALFIQNFAKERKKAGEKWLLQDASVAYKALPESEKAKLLEQLPALITQRKAVYDEFVSKLSPSEIVAENKTRAALRKTRIAAGKSVKNYSPIVDPNSPKKPMGAFFHYFKETRSIPELAGFSVPEQAKAIGEKWKQMSESEKSKYKELAEKEFAVYKTKYEEYYGKTS